MSEVVLERVCKVFPNDVQAVRNLDLAFEKGKITALLGPSGSGKTTTLRLIAGLETPSSGTIKIGGLDVTKLAPHERQVAMVFQNPALYPNLSVRDNLKFGARARESNNSAKHLWKKLVKLNRPHPSPFEKELENKVERAASQMRIGELLNRKPHQLSGGQQQRVALARALLRDPKIYLLDEPLSNLDGPLRADLRRELHFLQKNHHSTMVYVTHDQQDAMSLADKLVVLDRGEVQQVGPPGELFHSPRNLFVAGFIGWPPMNLVEGSVFQKESIWYFHCFDGNTIHLPKDRQWELWLDKKVIWGIRPEDVKCEEKGPTDLEIRMEITLVELLGRENLVTLERGGCQITSQWDSKYEVKNGNTVLVTFDMTRSYWFDGTTGLAIRSGRSSG